MTADHLPSPRVLTTVAGVLAAVILAQLGYLLARPELPPPEQQIAVEGLRGNAGRAALSDALCGLDLDLSHATLAMAHAAAVDEVAVALRREGIGGAAAWQLEGLAEALLARYDFARVYRDLGLYSAEQATWHLSQERARGVEAASQVVGPAVAQRFEVAVYGIWQDSWRRLLLANPEYDAGRKPRSLDAPGPQPPG